MWLKQLLHYRIGLDLETLAIALRAAGVSIFFSTTA
jgi:hypothetical protein